MIEFQKSWSIPNDVMPIWNTMVDADYSFVKRGDNSADLYILAMVVGLRIGAKFTLGGMTINWTYSGIADHCDVMSLTQYYEIPEELHVDQLSRYAGEGLRYIYEYHFDEETNILDIGSLIEAFSHGVELTKCNRCDRFTHPDKECQC